MTAPATLEQLQSSLGSAYTLERELGGGGMARVFVADEAALGRKVVVKLVAPELAHGLSVERFKREIQLAARLQHPHIVPLLSAGDAGGLPYYTMPFVAGQSLRERISREGRLPLGDAVRVLREVASALGYAHKQGVVHRDIKPENVLFSEGVAAVADFGIAKALTAARVEGDAGTTLTQLGTSIGTPEYMAPEQVSADPSVDHRADLYSLGVVAYELLTGATPFAGRSTSKLFVAHLTEVPAALPERRPDTPPALAAIVMRCLEKDPADRPQSVHEVVAALDEVAATLSGPHVTVTGPVVTPTGSSTRAAAPSVAVLPFVNMSADPEQAFFADGLTEEIIAALAGIRALRVISRTSVMRYKGSDRDLRTIARELGARYVLEGSVRRAGNSLRVTAQLIEADTDTHLWAERFGGTPDDVFAIQEEIARKIAAALAVTLTPGETRQLAERTIEDVRALDAYMRAQQLVYRWTPEALDEARRLIDAAMALAGEHATLLATRGFIDWMLVNTGLRGDERLLADAEASVQRALVLDPESSMGVFVRGLVAGKHGNVEDAVRDIRYAHERRPGDATVLTELSRYLWQAGQPEAVVPLVEELVRVDPLTPHSWILLASWGGPGRNERSRTAVRRARELAGPGHPMMVTVGWVLALLGERDEAVAVLDEVAQHLPKTKHADLGRFIRHSLAGDAERALVHLTPALTEAARWHEYDAANLADGFALLGRPAEAVHWLRVALSRGYFPYPFLAARNPFLDTVRGDVRFRSYLEEVRQKWEAFPAELTRGLSESLGRG